MEEFYYRNMKWKVIVTILLILILLGVVGIFVFTKNRSVQNKQPVPTTQPSPTIESQNPGWKTFTDIVQNVSFQYPENLQTKYIRPQEWPPKITVTSDSFSCEEHGLGINGLPGMTIQKKMDNTAYCIENVTEGSAGTFYTNYTHSFMKGSNLVKLEFTLAYPQCDNYSDPQKAECTNEHQTFDLDSLINRIAESVSLKSP